MPRNVKKYNLLQKSFIGQKDYKKFIFFKSQYRSTALNRQLISTCFFVSKGHFNTGKLHKVTHNRHLKIRDRFFSVDICHLEL